MRRYGSVTQKQLTSRNFTILIVDDLPDNLRLLSDALSVEGYDVRSAISGEIALMGIEADPPDLILLDIKMPGMNGYEVCNILQADNKTASTPIIFLSALENPDDKVKAFEIGGVDYITKPFQIAEVLARVKQQLTILHQREKIQIKNNELIQAIEQLDQFASTISHDLKQPIQSISLSAYLIEMKSTPTALESISRHLHDIRNICHTISSFIDGLLHYSRSNTSSADWTTVNLTDLVQQATVQLKSVIQDRQATINIQTLPTLNVNEPLLLQLFQNLIENAIKFTPAEERPIILITAQRLTEDSQPPTWLFCVQDNGIGIPEEQRTRIFDIFHRVEENKRHPGHGIGLATCKKIIQHHNGRLWVESKVGEGSSFYFTISPTMPTIAASTASSE